MNVNQDVLMLADLTNIIESHIPTIWQKYVNGVNMTFIDYDFNVPNATLPRKENNFYVLAHYTDKEYKEIDENSSYFCSMIAPLLMEVGKRVNYRFGDRRYGVNQYRLLGEGRVTSLDRVPQLYDFETENPYTRFNCSKPLHIVNQLSILSAIVKRDRSPTLDLWKAFHMETWICILFAFIFIITTDKLLFKRKISFSSLVWIYFKPLIGIGERLTYNNLIYLLWVLSIFPLTEIFKNELVANMVAVPIQYSDNIDDLLEGRLTLYTDSYKLDVWRDSKTFQDQLKDNDLYKKFDKLFHKVKVLDLLSEHWIKLIDEPKKLISVVKGSALLEDGESIQYFKSFLQRFISVHSAKEAYIPKLITPLCYRYDFKFPKETEEVSLQMFETSHFDYLTKAKVNFYTAVGIKLIRMFKGDHILDQFYDNSNEQVIETDLNQTRSLFIFLLYCHTLHIIVLSIEILFKHRK